MRRQAVGMIWHVKSMFYSLLRSLPNLAFPFCAWVPDPEKAAAASAAYASLQILVEFEREGVEHGLFCFFQTHFAIFPFPMEGHSGFRVLNV